MISLVGSLQHNVVVRFFQTGDRNTLFLGSKTTETL